MRRGVLSQVLAGVVQHDQGIGYRRQQGFRRPEPTTLGQRLALASFQAAKLAKQQGQENQHSQHSQVERHQD